MSLSNELEALKEFHCENRCVLSMYLNTNPGDPEQLNGAWRTHLKNGFKRLDEYLTASGDEEELKALNKLKKKITDEIEANKNNLNKSVVIFAADEPPLWSVHYVQVPVKTSFHWEQKPMIEEMKYMYKAYPEAGIILPSYAEVRILDTAMGAINEEFTYHFDAGIEDWREKKKAQEVANEPAIEARPRAQTKGFYKGMRKIIEKLKKERNWREIHITGEVEAANSFAEILPEKPASCIYKNLNNSKANDIISQVFEK